MMPLFSENIFKLYDAVGRAGLYLWGESENGSKVEVTVKPDHTIVLNLDLESNRIIRNALVDTLSLVSEEDVDSHALIDTTSEYFVIDPLDGTTSCKRFLTTIDGQIGFGPLAGYVRDGKLQAAAYFSVPHRTMFLAERGVGSFYLKIGSKTLLSDPLKPQLFHQLMLAPRSVLSEAGVLFYAGTGGETQLIDYLKTHNVIENIYRFGGFANDCTRVAQNFEQIQIQFSVKAWDLTAALIAELAGASIIVDPKNTCTPLSQWNVTHNNPVLISHPDNMEQMIEIAQHVYMSRS